MTRVSLLLSGLLAAAYLLWAPESADLAAQTFRGDLFADHGPLLWSNNWYGGHHIPGYSLVYPPLAAALGPRLLGAVAAVAAAGLFALLAHGRFGERAWLGSAWFALGSVTLLLTGRLTFALGVALGLGALLALQRGRRALAVGLGIACAAASPVAGLFLALAAGAVVLARAAEASGRLVRGSSTGAGAAIGSGSAAEGRVEDLPRIRRQTFHAALTLTLAAAATLALVALAFPSGGEEPFVASAFLPVPVFALAALALLPGRERALRWGLLLYALLALVAFLVPTPLGGNATRLGALFGGPVAALVLVGRRPMALALVALPLLYWQWVAPVRDVAKADGDPAVERSYYAPLLAELDRRAKGPVRVQIPPTRNRWEAAYVAPRYPLARGWLRQLESDDFELFRDGDLTRAAYRDWLAERGVGFVALPRKTELDHLAEDEARLIASDPPFLEAVWSNRHWSLYAVRDAQGLVGGDGARLTRLESDSFELRARRPGSYLVRVRHTPYWGVRSGEACVERDGEWTRVHAREAGRVRVAARLSLGGLLGREANCSA